MPNDPSTFLQVAEGAEGVDLRLEGADTDQ